MLLKDRVYQYMETYGGITQNEATKYIGCTDLAGAVRDLKKDGHIISGTWVKARNRWGDKVKFKRYYIIHTDREAR